MLNVNDPESVQIEVSDDGRVWVNIDGKCALRVYGSKDIEVCDARKVSLKDIQETK